MSTGLDSILGVSPEGSGNYGTYGAPNDWFEFDSESLAIQPNFLSSTGLGRGVLVPSVDRHQETTRSVGGSITAKVPNKGFGPILDMLHGNSVSPAQQGATSAYLQTHNVGSSRPNGKSLTIQVGKPQSSDGTVKPHSYLGCKFSQVSFNIDTNGELVAELTVDGRDEDLTESLETANVPSDVGSYGFHGVELKVASAVVDEVTSFGLVIPMPMATERFSLRRSALKSEPLVNDYVRPTFTMQAEYYDDTLYDHFRNEDEVEVIAEFEGATIEGAYNEMIRFTMAACKITGATPPVNGPGILTVEVPGEVYSDGTNEPVVIEYQSEDTTVYATS